MNDLTVYCQSMNQVEDIFLNSKPLDGRRMITLMSDTDRRLTLNHLIELSSYLSLF